MGIVLFGTIEFNNESKSSKTGNSYKLCNIEEYELPVFDDFDSLLNSIVSQIFITPNKQNIKKLSGILKNYMIIDNNQFIFPRIYRSVHF